MINYKEITNIITEKALKISNDMRQNSTYNITKGRIYNIAELSGMNLTEVIHLLFGTLVTYSLNNTYEDAEFLAYYDAYNEYSAALGKEVIFQARQECDKMYDKHIDELAKEHAEFEAYMSNLNNYIFSTSDFE